MVGARAIPSSRTSTACMPGCLGRPFRLTGDSLSVENEALQSCQRGTRGAASFAWRKTTGRNRGVRA